MPIEMQTRKIFNKAGLELFAKKNGGTLTEHNSPLGHTVFITQIPSGLKSVMGFDQNGSQIKSIMQFPKIYRNKEVNLKIYINHKTGEKIMKGPKPLVDKLYPILDYLF